MVYGPQESALYCLVWPLSLVKRLSENLWILRFYGSLVEVYGVLGLGTEWFGLPCQDPTEPFPGAKARVGAG